MSVIAEVFTRPSNLPITWQVVGELEAERYEIGEGGTLRLYHKDGVKPFMVYGPGQWRSVREK